MNRIERKTESIERISQVLGECRVCRIAINDENAPYIVPLSYGYELVFDKLFLYFHCAQKGKKILLLKVPVSRFRNRYYASACNSSKGVRIYC